MSPYNPQTGLVVLSHQTMLNALYSHCITDYINLKSIYFLKVYWDIYWSYNASYLSAWRIIAILKNGAY